MIKKEGKDEPRESRQFGKNCKSKQYFSLQQESKDTLSNIAYFCLKKQGKEGPLNLRKFQFRKNRKSNTNFPLQRKKHAKK